MPIPALYTCDVIVRKPIYIHAAVARMYLVCQTLACTFAASLKCQCLPHIDCTVCCAEVTEQLVICGQPSFNPLMLSALKGYKHSSVAWQPYMEFVNTVGEPSSARRHHDFKGCRADSCRDTL